MIVEKHVLPNGFAEIYMPLTNLPNPNTKQ